MERILMARSALGFGDVAAIALGGVLGASVRWLATSVAADEPSGGWFAYAPNTSVTVGTDIDGFTPVGSAETIAAAGGLPIDTLAVNLIGCLLLGGLTLLLARSVAVSRRLLVAMATGFCGSLTTFSTFAVEVAALLRARPIIPDQAVGLNVRTERDLPSLSLYLVLSIAGGALAFWIGRIVVTRIVRSSHGQTSGTTS